MKKVCWLFLILMIVDMAIIFMFSAQSAETSTKISNSMADTVVKKVTSKIEGVKKPELKTEKLEKIMRKIAHFTLFALLGIFTFSTLKTSGYIEKLLYIFALTIIICIIYAISDEVHQLFISGRNGNVTDVIIDAAGSVVGMIVAYLFSGISFSK